MNDVQHRRTDSTSSKFVTDKACHNSFHHDQSKRHLKGYGTY